MNFSTAFDSPVVVKIDGEELKLPRFTVNDFVEWGAALDAERLEKATADFDEDQKFRAIAYGGVNPIDFHQLTYLVQTPAGILHIDRTCMGKAGVSEEKIQRYLAAVKPGDLRFLAMLLTGLVNEPDPAAPKPPGEKGAEESPLAGGGTGSPS